MDIRRASLADQVAFRLVESIEEQGLVPGDELPPVAELAERFGVSRLVVREAIRTLSAREILVASQGRQARISTPSGAVLSQILQFRLRQRSLRLVDLFTVRELIECEAASLAAQRVASGSDPRVVRSIADAIRSAENRDAFVHADVGFHAAIAGLADNSLLAFILESFGDVLLQARTLTYDARSSGDRSHDETLEEHERIVTAIEAGDADAASRAMRDHIRSTAADVGKSTALSPTSATHAPPRRQSR